MRALEPISSILLLLEQFWVQRDNVEWNMFLGPREFDQGETRDNLLLFVPIFRNREIYNLHLVYIYIYIYTQQRTSTYMFDKTCTHTQINQLYSSVILFDVFLGTVSRQRHLTTQSTVKNWAILQAQWNSSGLRKAFLKTFLQKNLLSHNVGKAKLWTILIFLKFTIAIGKSIHHMGGLWHCFPNISSIYCYVGRWSSYGQRSCAKTPALSLRDSLDGMNPMLIQNPYIYNIKWFKKKINHPQNHQIYYINH